MATRRKPVRRKAFSRQKHSSQEAQHRLEKALRNWDRRLKPLTDAICDSQCLSGDDFAIRINARS